MNLLCSVCYITQYYNMIVDSSSLRFIIEKMVQIRNKNVRLDNRLRPKLCPSFFLSVLFGKYMKYFQAKVFIYH